MKRDERKMHQKYCDISNWLRMHKPRKGKENLEGGIRLAEDILMMINKMDGGFDDTAKVLTAIAIVRSYLLKGIGWAYYMNAKALMARYEELFDGDFWMGVHEDSIWSAMISFVKGETHWREYFEIRKKFK